MAFGYRLRSQQSSRVQVDETRAQQAPPPPTSSNGSSSGRHAPSNQDTHTHTSRQPMHRIRLDDDSSSAQVPPQQSHNNYLQQRLERAASNLSSNSSSSSSGAVHNVRRGRELSGSVLETSHTQSPHVRPGRTMTTVGMPMTATSSSSYLDDHAQAMELPRRRRGTTSAYSSARSTTSSSSAAASESEHRAPEPKVDVLFKGHLMVKRGLLKGLDKRFYFLTRGAPELYCCKDETSFDLWYASGWGVDASSAVAKSSGLVPVLVCTVLRADRAGDAGGNDRTIVLVAAPANGASAAKPATLKVYAESAEKCERWLHALHRVQLTRRAAELQDGDRPSPLAASSSSSLKSSRQRECEPEDDVVASPRLHTHVRTRQASRSEASLQSLPRAYANGMLRAASSRSDDVGSVKSSSSSAASDAAASVRSHAGVSNTGSQGNVLLFVPAAGSAISVSDSKLALARKQIDELIAAGAKRPTRSGMEANASGAPIAWRFGAPEYALADLEYMKHKEREHDATPLESYVEACCQTFVMEATHKARYDDWVSVDRDLFYLQVNDGPRVAGACIDDHDLFGLLFVNDVDVTDVDAKEGDAKHPRAILAEAFTEGFPMEVLAVYTQPPQCAFAWRHWGPFTGSYKGVKGDGRRLEIRGFGQIQIDASKMLHLRLFFKAKDLFDQLNVAAAELGAKARDVQRARAASSAVLPVPAVTAAATTATPARSPTTAPAKSKATLTADIVNDLANFTIASSTAARSKGTAAAAVG